MIDALARRRVSTFNTVSLATFTLRPFSSTSNLPCSAVCTSQVVCRPHLRLFALVIPHFVLGCRLKRVKDSGISSVFNKSYKDIDEWPSTGCIQSLDRSERGGAGSLGGQESRYDNRYHYVRNYLKKQVSERFKGRVNLEKVVEVLSPPRPDSGLLAGIMMIKAAIPSAPSVQAYKSVYIHGSLVVDSRLHTSSYRR